MQSRQCVLKYTVLGTDRRVCVTRALRSTLNACVQAVIAYDARCSYTANIATPTLSLFENRCLHLAMYVTKKELSLRLVEVHGNKTWKE